MKFLDKNPSSKEKEKPSQTGIAKFGFLNEEEGEDLPNKEFSNNLAQFSTIYCPNPYKFIQ